MLLLIIPLVFVVFLWFIISPEFIRSFWMHDIFVTISHNMISVVEILLKPFFYRLHFPPFASTTWPHSTHAEEINLRGSMDQWKGSTHQRHYHLLWSQRLFCVWICFCIIGSYITSYHFDIYIYLILYKRYHFGNHHPSVARFVPVQTTWSWTCSIGCK